MTENKLERKYFRSKNLKILVVGNDGSFLVDVASGLSKSKISYNVLHAPNEPSEIELKLTGIDLILYISGETRFEEKMEWLNYELPKQIYDQARANDLGFIYLSSLSVFGEISSDIVTVNSERKPVDIYGASKNKFDEYVQSTLNQEKFKVGAIFPASIHADKGRSSVEKFEQLMTRFPLLRYIKLPGSLSFVRRKELISTIVDAVANERYQNMIASENQQLSNYANRYSIKLPKIFVSFFKITNMILGKRKSLVLRMLLRGIEYK